MVIVVIPSLLYHNVILYNILQYRDIKSGTTQHFTMFLKSFKKRRYLTLEKHFNHDKIPIYSSVKRTTTLQTYEDKLYLVNVDIYITYLIFVLVLGVN